MARLKKKHAERKERKGKSNEYTLSISLSSVSNANHVHHKVAFWRLSKFSFDTAKIPVITYEAGMKGKDPVKIKSQQVGLIESLYHLLKRREKEKKISRITLMNLEHRR